MSRVLCVVLHQATSGGTQPHPGIGWEAKVVVHHARSSIHVHHARSIVHSHILRHSDSQSGAVMPRRWPIWWTAASSGGRAGRRLESARGQAFHQSTCFRNATANKHPNADREVASNSVCCRYAAATKHGPNAISQQEFKNRPPTQRQLPQAIQQ